MRIIRLLGWALLGYMAYEVVQCLSYVPPVEEKEPQLSPGQQDLEEALENSPGGRMNITGTGRGTMQMSEDASGESVPHPVGRGVTRGRR